MKNHWDITMIFKLTINSLLNKLRRNGLILKLVQIDLGLGGPARGPAPHFLGYHDPK